MLKCMETRKAHLGQVPMRSSTMMEKVRRLTCLCVTKGGTNKKDLFNTVFWSKLNGEGFADIDKVIQRLKDAGW